MCRTYFLISFKDRSKFWFEKLQRSLRNTEKRTLLSVNSVPWYEKSIFMFIYEPQFIADSVVDFLCQDTI